MGLPLTMIQVELVKMDRTGVHCANPACQKDPRYLINILGDVWYIKVDTTVALISNRFGGEYYCRGCVEEVLNLFRTKLDPKLWAFH